jgi:hypothetical protein
MKWSSQEFQSYDRWQFEFMHTDYPIYLVIKRHYYKYGICLWRAVWRTDKMRGAQYEVTTICATGNAAAGRKDLFKKLRYSLNYGLNVRSQAVTDRLRDANNQYRPGRKSIISGSRKY